MKTWRRTSVMLALLAFWPLLIHPSPSGGEGVREATKIELNGHMFTLPAGFEIELAAGAPLVDRPIVADFDEQGRLYVADSSGSNENVQEQLKKKPHRIVRLEDADGDGKFDRRTVFADQMMFPEGAMWHKGSLYVAAPPSIWKLTDKDGDGVADERSEWFKGKTLTGCANDLHGPYLGPDGWIYWAKGAFAQQTYERPGKPPFVTRAAHIFRARPDGSNIEPVMTGGMDNPVDVVFTPGGERVFTTTFFQIPGGGQRDGLIHAIYGGVYGKDHDPAYEHKWTSPAFMPVLTHMGPAAPAGLCRYESAVFGPDFQDNLFAAQFNMHKVSRHILTPEGATFRCKDEDFLVSANHDFHPTDVLEDADGSLLVVDTGGWYKLCCPSSQLHKPDILGAIYRVRRKGSPAIVDPRGLKLDWAKMSAIEAPSLLGDARPAVRRRAIQTLADMGPEAGGPLTATLRPNRPAEARRNAVWAAARIDHANARAIARQALADPDDTVRQTAIHSIGVWRDRDALPALLPLLKSKSLHNRRAAAEALGRIGDKAAVPALLEAAGEPADRALEHSLTFALIEIADRNGTAAGLQSPNLLLRRAALIALDQMDGGKLDAETVARELASADAKMKETAWWIASRRPEWSANFARFLRERIVAKNLPAAEQDELIKQLARFAKAAATQQLLADFLGADAAPLNARRIILRAMAQSALKEAPEPWLAVLTKTLSAHDAELAREAIATVRSLRVPSKNAGKITKALLEIAKSTQASTELRLQALAAVPGGVANVDPALLDFLRGELDQQRPAAIRTAAADVLSRAKLTTDQLMSLTESIKAAAPAEIERLLDAFASSTDEKVGLTLIAALNGAPQGLRVETLKPRLARFPPTVHKEADKLYASISAETAQQKAKLEELLATMKPGDIRRGQLIFNGPKAACSSCHAIGYLGGKIGPDLTHIGRIRNERDLLESMVFPSVSFVQSYQPMLVVTKDGRTLNGLIRKEDADAIILTTAAEQESTIPRTEIEEMRPSKISIMPAGLDQQLSPQDLADVVAFLKACK